MTTQLSFILKFHYAMVTVILTWDPKYRLPVFPAQVEQVQHPFMVNQTDGPQMETHFQAVLTKH